MTLAQTSTLRKWVGAAGAVFCVLFFLSLFDTLITGIRQPSNYFPCVPGQSMAATGPLFEKIGNIGELTYLTDSQELNVVFDDLQTGFWLGGRMWRGRIVVGPKAKPGLHEVMVQIRDGAHGISPYRFRVKVFTDASSLRRASPSCIGRYIGVSSWMAVMLFAPLVLFTFVTVFLLSQRASRLMEREGRAEIWRVAEVEKGYEIHFGLGLSQGIRQGDILALLDDKERPLGSAIVRGVFRDHSIALAGREFFVKPGFMVSRSL
jgi:hypothetical protein